MVDGFQFRGIPPVKRCCSLTKASFIRSSIWEGVAKAIERDGRHEFTLDRMWKAYKVAENPSVGSIQDGPTVKAKCVVVATNTPINDWATIQTKRGP